MRALAAANCLLFLEYRVMDFLSLLPAVTSSVLATPAFASSITCFMSRP